MIEYGRAVRGAEAGAIAAGTVELAFFVLDLVRLDPLATPGLLSGAALGPGGVALDLTNVSGVIAASWAAYQIILLTFAHFLIFAGVGVVASLAFDWSRPLGVGRFAALFALSTLGLLGTVAWSSSVVALESIGPTSLIGMNVLAAAVLGGALRFVSMPDAEDEPGR